jgi:ribosome maturation protein SDO1
MTDVIARIKIKGKNYEVLVDVDKALKMKKGANIGINEVLSMDGVFYDSKKGLHVSNSDLQQAFATSDELAAAEKIIKQGEIQVPQEYKNKERDDKKKQIIDFLSRNAIDPRTNSPHTVERISSAIEEAGINIENKPIEGQITKIVEKIKTIIPIKIQTKRLKIRIPAEHTGRAYGIITEYKESEKWLSNGELETIINLPVGLQEGFYDKLNSITHGSAITQEIKEEEK